MEELTPTERELLQSVIINKITDLRKSNSKQKDEGSKAYTQRIINRLHTIGRKLDT